VIAPGRLLAIRSRALRQKQAQHWPKVDHRHHPARV